MLVCHFSCPMMNPVRDHHQSLDPCASSASEYPSSVPCIESSLVEVHRNVSPPIPCQKASNEQEVGYASVYAGATMKMLWSQDKKVSLTEKLNSPTWSM